MTIKFIRLLAYLILLGTLLVGSRTATASTTNRVLPVREAEFLAKLYGLPDIHRVYSGRLSPDGKWLVYSQQKIDASGRSSAAGTTWLVNTENGLKQLIGDEDEPSGIELSSYRWSPDGGKFGRLERSNATLQLRLWDSTEDPRSILIALPDLGFAGVRMQDGALGGDFDWAWVGNDAIVLLLTGDRLGEEASESTSFESKKSWAWVMSRDQPMRSYRPEAGKPQYARYILKIGLRTGAVHVLSDDVDKKIGRDLASVRNSRCQSLTLQRGGETALIGILGNDAIDNSYLMSMMDNGDLKGHRYADPPARLYELDVLSGTLSELYAGGPGALCNSTHLRGSNQVAFLEATPRYSTWPLADRFGVLRVTQQAPNGGEIVLDDVSLHSALYASDRQSTLYLAESRGGYVTRAPWGAVALDEVDLLAKKRTKLTPDGMAVSWFDVSDNGKTIVAMLENVSTPPELYVWKSQLRQWHKITDEEKNFGDIGNADLEWFTWRSGDDRFNLDGVLVKPWPLDPDKRYPLIVVLQGGSLLFSGAWQNMFYTTGTTTAGMPPARILANAGYMVLMPNHRQSAGRASSDFARSIIGHYGDHVSLDIEAGVDALVRRGWVDPERIAITGNSHGSDEVIHAISQSGRYKAAVLIDGPVGLHDLWIPAIEYEPFSSAALKMENGRVVATRLMGFDPVERQWSNPFDIRTPLLMRWTQLGSNERGRDSLGDIEEITFRRRAAVAQTYKFLYALHGNGVPVDVIIDRDEHSNISEIYMLEWQSRILQWFDYFLLGKGENPVPAMKSPIDYTKQVEALNRSRCLRDNPQGQC